MIKAITAEELERIRLILSTYQDGTGMLKNKRKEVNYKTLPGWRDFERTTAAAMNGIALEDKNIYDVLIEHPTEKDCHIGISCKMRKMLNAVVRTGRVTIELSNAAGEFWDLLRYKDITQENYGGFCKETGIAIIERVEEWHSSRDHMNKGTVVTDDSYFLILQYDIRNGEYQLFQFSIDMPDPNKMEWSSTGRRLTGKVDGKVLIEWYGLSGGQLKYYPHIDTAVWKSDRFKLEALPDNLEDVMKEKAAVYFPEKWNIVK
jgi:hypothetical protein